MTTTETDGDVASATPNSVLLYEPVEHHRRDGANFLFADGSVRFIQRTQARAMIQQLEKGINPPDPNAIAPPESAMTSVSALVIALIALVFALTH